MHVSRQLGPFSGGGRRCCARCGTNQVSRTSANAGRHAALPASAFNPVRLCMEARDTGRHLAPQGIRTGLERGAPTIVGSEGMGRPGVDAGSPEGRAASKRGSGRSRERRPRRSRPGHERLAEGMPVLQGGQEVSGDRTIRRLAAADRRPRMQRGPRRSGSCHAFRTSGCTRSSCESVPASCLPRGPDRRSRSRRR